MEEFLIRVSWSVAPDHRVRRGEVMADVGLSPPNPPLTDAEMQRVTFAAKMAMLKCLRLRKRTFCAQCKAERCGHLHTRRCPVVANGAALEKCRCRWIEAKGPPTATTFTIER